MNPNQETERGDDFAEEIEMASSPSVDDFIRELEAKESELDITADLTIEVEQSEFDDRNIPDFVMEEVMSRADRSAAAADRAPANELHTEISSLKGEIARMEGERDEMVEKSKVRVKEFENFKIRLERERRETFINQMGNLATQMLPVLDNLERALDFAAEMPEEKRAEFEQFFDGIVLVNQQVNEVFSSMGVSPIPSVGEDFNPHYHEAVATEETDRFPKNTVSQELLRGYRIGEKVIRHSMVKVATPSTSRKAETIAAEPPAGQVPAPETDNVE
jgi:molecular chaperone GrpE